MSKARADGQGQRSTHDGRLVAIVDDDPSVRTSTRRLVRSFGFRAEAFASGEELLESELVIETACLLLDVRMPGMDGLEVQRRLAERGLGIPIVFITGRASEDEERRAWAAGAVEFLRKPVDTATLLRVLQQIIGKP
jgi:FixJ family two-component response regulator